MTKISQLNKVKSAIENALRITTDVMPNDKHMSEAKIHLRQAIQSVEKAASNTFDRQKKQTQFESWWGNIVAGTAKMSQGKNSSSSISQSLATLQAMIDEEASKINNQIKNDAQIHLEQDLIHE